MENLEHNVVFLVVENKRRKEKDVGMADSDFIFKTIVTRPSLLLDISTF